MKQEEHPKASAVPWYKRDISFLPVKTVELVTLSKNLSVMLKAGLTVFEAIDVLAEQTSGKLKRVVNRIFIVLQQGGSFGDALEKEEKTFGPVFISSVRIGESSGTLAQNMQQLAIQMEKDLTVRRNIQSAMLYPVIVTVGAFLLGLGIANFVLPQMVGIFTSLNADLPWTTQALIWVAQVFDDYGHILTPALILGLVFVVWLLRRKALQPIVHRVMLKLPAVGDFLHEVNRARFCRSIGTLLESGTPIQEALEITGKVLPNVVYRSSLTEMQHAIEAGQSFAAVMERYPELYPKLIQRMVGVGERVGGMGETLLYLAVFYEQKVDVQARNFSSVIEPILLLFIGILVAFIAISILSPIYSITSSIRI